MAEHVLQIQGYKGSTVAWGKANGEHRVDVDFTRLIQMCRFDCAHTLYMKKLAEADGAISRGPHGKAILLEIHLGERSAGLK